MLERDRTLERSKAKIGPFEASTQPSLGWREGSQILSRIEARNQLASNQKLPGHVPNLRAPALKASGGGLKPRHHSVERVRLINRGSPSLEHDLHVAIGERLECLEVESLGARRARGAVQEKRRAIGCRGGEAAEHAVGVERLPRRVAEGLVDAREGRSSALTRPRITPPMQVDTGSSSSTRKRRKRDMT